MHINIDGDGLIFSGDETRLSKVIDDMPTEDQGQKEIICQYPNVEEPSKTDVPEFEQVDLAGKISKCESFRFPFSHCNDFDTSWLLDVNTGS